MRSIFKKSIIVSALVFTSAGAISGPSNVPFQATVVVTDSISPSGAPACEKQSDLYGTNAGSGMTIGAGNASHLGHIAFVGTDCVRIIGSSKSGLPIFYFRGLEGALTITTDSGEKLYGSYQGTFIPTEGPVEDGLVPYKVESGQFTISNGTGLFANVKASGNLTGTEKLNLGTTGKGPASNGTIFLNGRISY